jgi:glutaredoxin-related protein
VTPLLYFVLSSCFPLCPSGVDFVDVNVLEDELVRQGIKDFRWVPACRRCVVGGSCAVTKWRCHYVRVLCSGWPTIPQLFVGGEFIGGCDIVTQMHQNGELEDVLSAK